MALTTTFCVAEGSFVFEQLGNFLGHDGQGLSFFIATVYNGRDVQRVTQAAARTFPQVTTHLGVQSEISHFVSPK
jgi:hypothetical protein